MPNTLTDFKQLSRALFKKSPPPPVDPVPVEKPVVDEGAEVLAYFSRPSQNAHRKPRVASEAKRGADRVAELEAALETKDAALNSIAEEKVAAERSGRERRAEILRCVLAANQSAGDLERRRVELRQILKDAGYFNDPKPLERLGLRLISGRNHWKLQYANVRVTLAKTPSDYRANLNSGNEIANRCF